MIIKPCNPAYFNTDGWDIECVVTKDMCHLAATGCKDYEVKEYIEQVCFECGKFPCKITPPFTCIVVKKRLEDMEVKV